MATIDDILAAMPEPTAEGDREYLTIDPITRTITVPESEKVFGVTGDELADRKFFICPRYVGDGLDLAAMFIRVNFRNANGEEDGYLVNDVAVSGEYVTFSWQLWPKVAAYKGEVLFGVCADLPDTPGRKMPDWNTALASGEVLEGLHPDGGDVEAETSDVVTQLRAETAAQTVAVEATGAAQVQNVRTAAAESTADAKAQIEAKGEAVRASIPADYATLAGTVDRLAHDRAAAIVCDAAGTSIQIPDASADPLQGLRIFGRSTQAGDPTPDNPVDIVSLPAPVVTVADGAGGNVQTLAIITPDGLPGVPVTSGGNYTDADGQQWIADEVDLARGVYVQRIKVAEFIGDTSEKWVRDYTADESKHRVVTSLFADIVKKTENNRVANILCNRFLKARADDTYSLQERISIDDLGRLHVYHGADSDSVEDWQTFLEANPMTVLCELAAPVETPLTTEELQAFRALHSVKPTTTVLNDAGAWMAVEYAADPKLYIDRKIAELVAANNN